MRADDGAERIDVNIANPLVRFDAGRSKCGFSQRLRNNIGGADLCPIAGIGVDNPVSPVSYAAGEGDRSIARYRPRGGRPDDDGRVIVFNREGDVDRIADIVFVFDLRFSERSFFQPHSTSRAWSRDTKAHLRRT